MNNASSTPVVFINGLIGTLNDPEIHRQFSDRPFLAPDLYGFGKHRARLWEKSIFRVRSNE
jgi:hypothetical protein